MVDFTALYAAAVPAVAFYSAHTDLEADEI
jgi:hypothetical protein